MKNNLTEDNVFFCLLRFSIPFLFSCFLQTLYGLVDLLIIGIFNGTREITAVSIGSQILHMITVIIAGLSMGTTVYISRSVGAKSYKNISCAIGNPTILSAMFAFIFSMLTILFSNQIMNLLSTPKEAFIQTKSYGIICFVGIPFITAYNLISAIFRGLGDSKHPMYFIIVAGIINIILDYFFIGILLWGAKGAAYATIISQGISVVLAIIYLIKMKKDWTISINDFRLKKTISFTIAKVGIPIALQDALIQISFLIITIIANSKGLIIAASVGIVEKIISFMFLVPSAMLSSVSALTAQNIGANKNDRAEKTLFYGIACCIVFGFFMCTISQIIPEKILGIFANSDKAVIKMGSQYLRSYTIDCIVAGIHFCLSGFFCAYGKSLYSFMHNMISIVLFRIPIAYFASKIYLNSLYPMGLAAPIGSLFSVVLCIVLFFMLRKKISNKTL